MIFKNPPENFKPEFEVVSCFCEWNSKILLLYRQDHKPQGGTWGVPAGKVEDKDGGDLFRAIKREVKDETGLDIPFRQFSYYDKVYVRFSNGLEFVYHMFSIRFDNRPEIVINPKEHSKSCWKTPIEALEMNLIEDGDACIRLFYGI